MTTRASESTAGWRLEHTYAQLPGALWVSQAPEPVSQPRMIVFNERLAAALGLVVTEFQGEAAAAVLAGNVVPVEARPIAQAYAGHQFGHFTMLGDGRALLLGEQCTPSGERCDIQLKGSGRTPFSRGGDGRAALGPMLREYLISEAMHAFGIPTTRSLAVVATGDEVIRQEALPGAVLTRVAASHLRVGTFEYAAATGDRDVLHALAAYTQERHFPDTVDVPNRWLALLESVVDRQASLIAQWQAVGFIHGVMNTDNMALSGETIDYGPCAFMDRYDPATVFSSIDRLGRYAYRQQPMIAQWNLARFAEALLPLIDADPQRALDQASAVVYGFPDRHHGYWLSRMREKLGLPDESPGDQELIDDLLAWMAEAQADFTNTFVALTAGERPADASDGDEVFDAWHGRWRARCGGSLAPDESAVELMRRRNPAVIPRNHLVEEALEAAFRCHDLDPFRRLLGEVSDPYDHERKRAEYQLPAPAEAAPYRTFCGT